MKAIAQHTVLAALVSGGLAALAPQGFAQGGVPLWTNRYAGPINGYDVAIAVAVDSSGNVFVTGGSLGANGRLAYATVGYSSAGTPLWTNRYQGGPFDSAATAVAVGSSGQVFVTGQSST